MHKYLSVRQIAERHNIPYGSIKSMVARRIAGQDNGFPLPDAQIGEHDGTGGRGLTYGWKPATIDTWHATYQPGHSRTRTAK
ncbi:hypothetical protein [Gordonia sp. (in: high G+C Gram-positive bacteria)]|uniref:hypothetical protein n=1 Tax=Gordonia sp. (in: high G+C Gram-positive bacteria) TaxID=84139 RepID=UPI001D35478F|nr:hypothetical protein [Gordonia sp. (in: high G+C Gram-positive bacteria)]MCB1295818.1 hypothetical protein [Gordonia sp. (in: high G+C Gram-positive bacteria)]HMS75617.1 hypothetical protein [Gordonia sp. (in: high G+C Gram-positive bacteria)]HQV20350.1 hypothetical protein [Gordonia sp. (in: high G+C Gram-positive bacteria)]